MTLRFSRLALLLTLLLAATTAGCTDASSSVSATATSPSGQPTSSTSATTHGDAVENAEAVLKEQAVALRAFVDDLIKNDKARGASTIDRHTPCALGQQGRYPVSWSYGWRLFLEIPDSRPTARAYADRLKQQGFSVAPFGDPNDKNITLVAQKNGTRITLTAGTTEGAMAVVGDSACVKEDGSLITSRVS